MKKVIFSFVVLLAACTKKDAVVSYAEPLTATVVHTSETLPVSFAFPSCSGEMINFTGTIKVDARLILGSVLVLVQHYQSNLIGIGADGQVYRASNKFQANDIVTGSNYIQHWTVNDKYIGGKGGMIKITVVTSPAGSVVESIIVNCKN